MGDVGMSQGIFALCFDAIGAMWRSRGPRTKGGQCRRSPKEQALGAALGWGETLLCTYRRRLRRVDMTWTRYLAPALQSKLLARPRNVNEAVRREVESLFDLIELNDENRAVLYFVVPQRGM